jgi:hypothetical protein
VTRLSAWLKSLGARLANDAYYCMYHDEKDRAERLLHEVDVLRLANKRKDAEIRRLRSQAQHPSSGGEK